LNQATLSNTPASLHPTRAAYQTVVYVTLIIQ